MATVFLANTLIDGSERDPINNAAVVVDNGVITQVGSQKNLSYQTNRDQVYEFEDGTLMPGMIDSHCHLFSIAGRPKKPASDWEPELLIKYISDGLENARWWLSQGVTTVRDLGTILNLDLGLRDLIAQKKVDGPRIFGSGKPIVMTGRSPFSDPERELEVNSAEEARRAARQQLRSGADLIKLFASAGVGGAVGKRVGESGWEQLTVEEMKAAVIEAHKAGRPVTAHAINTQSIKNALLAGVDSVEHANYIDDESITLMKARNVVMVPTLAVTNSLASRGTEFGFGPHMEVNAKKAVEIGTERVLQAYQAGVRIAAGTDPTRADTMLRECLCLNRAGLSPMDVLIAATRTGAELVNAHDRLGTIEQGKIADLLILAQNPLEDLNALEKVLCVVKDGKVVAPTTNVVVNLPNKM